MVRVEAEVARGRERSSLWCVLDTGAVGASLMLSRPAAEQLGLLRASAPEATAPSAGAAPLAAHAALRGDAAGVPGGEAAEASGRADRRAELGPGVKRARDLVAAEPHAGTLQLLDQAPCWTSLQGAWPCVRIRAC